MISALIGLLGKTVLALTTLAAVLLVCLAVLIAAEIPISLTPLRESVERMATIALGRQVEADGIEVTLAVQPRVAISGLRISNPPAWQEGDFARIGQTQIRFSLLSLLSGRLEIQEINAEDVTLALIHDPKDGDNWHFGSGAAKPRERSGSAWPLRALDTLAVRRLTFHYRDAAANRSATLIVDELSGKAPAAAPLQLRLNGSWRQQPITGQFNAGTLAQLTNLDKPWPVALDLSSPGVQLQISGTLGKDWIGAGLDIALRFESQTPGALTALTGVPFPDSCALQGRLSTSTEGYRLSEFQTILGNTRAHGTVTFNLADPARLSGRLSIADFDTSLLQPLLDNRTPAGRVDQLDIDFNSQGFRLKTLIDNLELSLRLDNARLDFATQGQGLPLALSTAELTLERDQSLSATAVGTLRDSPLKISFAGRLPRERVSDIPVPLELSMVNGDNRLQLSGTVTAKPRAFDVQINLSGARFGTLAPLLGLPATGQTAYSAKAHLIFANNALNLDELQAHVGQNQLSGNIIWQGIGASNPLLRVKLHAPRLATAELNALFDRNATPPGELSVTEAKTARPNLGRGQSRTAEAALNLDRSVRRSIQGALTRQGFDTRGIDGIFGQNTRRAIRGFQQSLGLPVTGYLTEQQRDLLLVQGNLPETPGAPSPAGVADGFLDIPLLPAGLHFVDTDFILTVDRIALTSSNLTNLALTGKLRDGRMEHTAFEVALNKARLDGEAAIDWRGEIPALNLRLASEDIDLGELLRQLGIAQDVDLRAALFHIDLQARGTTPRQLLTHATVNAIVENGRWLLGDSAFPGRTTFHLERGTLQAAPGKLVRLQADVRLQDTPLELAFDSEPLAVLADSGAEKWRFKLNGQGAGARLEMDGAVFLPFASKHYAVSVTLEGERLDSLNRLLAIKLPPWRSYRVGGLLSVVREGYDLIDLKVRVAGSELHGGLSLITTGDRPRLNINLQSDALQLTDFGIDPWLQATLAAETSNAKAATAKKSADQNRRVAGQPIRAERGRMPYLLSPQYLGNHDSKIALSVDRIMLGSETLGSGSLALTLGNGRLHLKRLRIDLPSGSIQTELMFEPSEHQVAADLRVLTQHFDYGMLARRINPQTKMSGVLGLDVALTSRAPSIDTLRQYAGGQFNFDLWPNLLEAGVMDVWAINLFDLLLPFLESGKSDINCVRARFNVSDGLMITESLLIDTTKVRVRGEGQVNLKTEAVELLLIPRVKKTQLFNLATPIRVRGKFGDFHVGVPVGSLISTATQFALQTRLWSDLFNRQQIPATDGSDVCGVSGQSPLSKAPYTKSR